LYELRLPTAICSPNRSPAVLPQIRTDGFVVFRSITEGRLALPRITSTSPALVRVAPGPSEKLIPIAMSAYASPSRLPATRPAPPVPLPDRAL